MINNQDSTVYARLSDDKKSVVEYPVFGLHIKNRAHPFDWYTKVIFDPQLAAVAFHSVKEVQTIRDGQLYISYESVADTLDQMLAQIANGNALPGSGVTTAPAMNISEVPTVTINRVKYLAEVYAQKVMDDFAAFKGYDNIGSACSYVGSKIATFKSDADKCIDIRDQVWVKLPLYFDKVMAAEVAIPKTSADILAQLPVMVW